MPFFQRGFKLKLEVLTLKNFRCFGDEEVHISMDQGLTVFVGGNGTGKTAAFEALSRLFGISSHQRNITRRDFHLARDNPELASGSSLVLEAVFGFPELEELDESAFVDAVPEFFLQMGASAPGAPLKVRMRLQAIWTDDGTPDGSVDEDIRWIPVLDEQFEWEECRRVQAAERGSIQLIYIPAARDADSQVAKILKGRLWKAARWTQEFQDVAATSTLSTQQGFEREAPAQFVLERLANRWKEVHEADTDTTPMLRLIEDRFEELVRNAMFTFSPDEAGKERSMDDLSDGQRSLFHIALTAATLEVERDAFLVSPEESPFEHEKLRQAHLTLLAVEEPENSLSPFFLSRIIRQARDISENPTAQVALSSHSPAILGRIDPEEVRFFRLDRQTRQSAVKEIELPTEDLEARQFVRLAVKAYPEIYFARYVILGEGDSERLVIPRVAQAMGVDLDQSFVPIVPLAGRFVGHFWRLLSGLGIPFATLMDFDLGRLHGGANMLRTTLDQLVAIGSQYGRDNVPHAAGLQNRNFLDGWEANVWLQSLATQNVYFSYPLDIDFSMLRAFGDAYKNPNNGGRGPRLGADAILGKKQTTLKHGGDGALYDDSFDEDFGWYPYLFLSRSKPETHIVALSRISNADLARLAPIELRALITRVMGALGLEVNGA
ncbi:AAA family ATPase [Sneathiella sp. P13V-1]|uniref:ATP-dependent nuclease n=1 Tax=Sneathiella sp. P13V-1 TaxID=2697366 RepID=UPI001D100C73|nr:AAA family ATPase [Sneathiella sp. P13V-1]MBE7638239.1 AAA family ATPase [Sneathiella sp. P13V-1]